MNFVEGKIKKKHPDKFSIFSDAWIAPSTHYAAIYSWFPTNNSLGYEYCLLGFRPYEAEPKLGTNELYEYISFAVSVYENKWDHVTCLI